MITQFFFDPTLFLRFRDRLWQAGLRCAVTPRMVRRFERAGADDGALREAAVETVFEITTALQCDGVETLHLYTLNRIRTALAIHDALNGAPIPSAVS